MPARTSGCHSLLTAGGIGQNESITAAGSVFTTVGRFSERLISACSGSSRRVRTLSRFPGSDHASSSTRAPPLEGATIPQKCGVRTMISARPSQS